MFQLNKIVRKNILDLKSYSSARDEYTGDSAIFLDANENPFASAYNRYPDPQQRKLKQKIAKVKDVLFNRIFLGNGSDEPIDLLFRVFCEPGINNVIIPNPTYGMYEVCADINNVEYKKVSLTENFQLDINKILEAVDNNTRLIFICSPNNPTANSFKKNDIIKIIESFDQGLVILDEAYIDFSKEKSFLPLISNFSNLVILQTFSKAWGLAGIRLGMAFAQKGIIELLTKVKYPYNVNIITQKVAMDYLEDVAGKNYWVKEILKQRNLLQKELMKFGFTENILPSETNFLMVKVVDPRSLYNFLVNKKIIVRDRSKVHLCMGYIRITVGTQEENLKLLEALKEFEILNNKAKITGINE